MTMSLDKDKTRIMNCWSLPKVNKIIFPRQSLKRFTFRVKISDSIFFLLGLSPIVKFIPHEK